MTEPQAMVSPPNRATDASQGWASPGRAPLVVRYLELIRFSHTVFALPFAIISATLAYQVPIPSRTGVAEGLSAPAYPAVRWQVVVGILACMVTARSAAMAFNRLVDREFDATNPRTRGRHLVTGSLSVMHVTWFTIVACMAFMGATCLFLPNRLPLLLSLPVLAFLGGYSYTKRFTSFAHFWLGTSLMLAPICAWIAVRGEWIMAHPADILPAMILGIGVLLWVSGFDIIYACQDVGHDRASGLLSVPARLGILAALRVAAVCHAGTILALAALPWLCSQLQLGGIYRTGIVAAAILLAFEHALVRPNDLSRVNQAFFGVNAVMSLGLMVVVLCDIWW